MALEDSTLLFYKDKFLVNRMRTPDVVTAIMFGRLGREDGSLVLVTKGQQTHFYIELCYSI